MEVTKSASIISYPIRSISINQLYDSKIMLDDGLPSQVQCMGEALWWQRFPGGISLCRNKTTTLFMFFLPQEGGLNQPTNGFMYII